MYRDVLDQLAAVSGRPCLTITLPTHRTSPENRQDPIRLANLVRRAQQMLTDELDAVTAEQMRVRLNELTVDLGHQMNLDGMALFVEPDAAQLLRLPCSVEEQVTLADRFALLELYTALQQTFRYAVLVLAEQSARLLIGSADQLQEISEPDGFPLSGPPLDGEALRTNSWDVNTALLHEQLVRAFLHEVDQAFARRLGQLRLPLILVGVAKHLAAFSEISRHRSLIAAQLNASAGRANVRELAQLIAPARAEALQAEDRRWFAELQQALEQRRAVVGPAACLDAAAAGRIHRLLIEQDYQPPVNGTSAVDVRAIIAEVTSHGGSVHAVSSGVLTDQERIAAIARY